MQFGLNVIRNLNGNHILSYDIECIHSSNLRESKLFRTDSYKDKASSDSLLFLARCSSNGDFAIL